MLRFTNRETSLVMALLAFACLALGIFWYLDRTALAQDLEKSRADHLWLIRRTAVGSDPAASVGER